MGGSYILSYVESLYPCTYYGNHGLLYIIINGVAAIYLAVWNHCIHVHTMVTMVYYI